MSKTILPGWQAFQEQREKIKYRDKVIENLINQEGKNKEEAERLVRENKEILKRYWLMGAYPFEPAGIIGNEEQRLKMVAKIRRYQ